MNDSFILDKTLSSLSWFVKVLLKSIYSQVVKEFESCTREDSGWTLGKNSSLGVWSNTETGFVVRLLIPCACQHSRSLWIMFLIICFNFWLVLKESGSWTRWFSKVPSSYSIHKDLSTEITCCDVKKDLLV